MHIKAKLYPYPVLANFNDDYVDSKFNVFVIIQSFPNELLIQFKPELNNAGIKSGTYSIKVNLYFKGMDKAVSKTLKVKIV